MSNPRIRPDLPVGSPERALFFGQLRGTFNEDWENARKALDKANRIAMGDLYFIKCAGAVKIGRTTNIVARLTNMQSSNPHEIDCLLLLKGRGHEELKWHKRFARYRIRGEWFKLTPTLKKAIERERWFDGSPLYEPATEAELAAL